MPDATSYTPDPYLIRWEITCCRHCGHVPANHHTDARCYTSDEIGARLHFWQRTGRWPAPDEGCTIVEESPPCA